LEIRKVTTELKPDAARQSIKTGHMRYVLGVSLTLAVIAMAIAYFALLG
jgi:hypothetical protein